jgi:GNAT superfamily N-acetyltransferase
MGDLVVRTAAPDDAEGIARVHTTTWQTAYRGVVPDEVLDGLDPVRRAAFWRRALAEPADRARVRVAVDDGEVVGFASVGPARDEDVRASGFAELQAVYVHPSRWGDGTGPALLDAALAGVAAPGVVLWVLADNPRARRFYERAGFTADGATRVEHVGGRDLVEVRYARAA